MSDENFKNHVIKRLKEYDKTQIILTKHAQIQAAVRGIEINEIKDNLMNPVRLTFAGKQEALEASEEKFDCYFVYSKTQCHRYVIVFSKGLIICTVIKINRRWQRAIDRYARI